MPIALQKTRFFQSFMAFFKLDVFPVWLYLFRDMSFSLPPRFRRFLSFCPRGCPPRKRPVLQALLFLPAAALAAAGGLAFGARGEPQDEKPGPVYEAIGSLASVFYMDQESKDKGQTWLFPQTGFFVKDHEGETRLMTAFGPASRLLLEKKKLKARAVPLSAFRASRGGRPFQLKAIRAAAPAANLLLWDLEEPPAASASFAGAPRPLALREGFAQKGEGFYVAGISPKNGRRKLSIKKASGMKYIKELDFMSFLSEEGAFFPEDHFSPVLDQKGRLVSVLDIREHNHGLGPAPKDLKELLEGKSLNCKKLSPEGCILKARKALYEKASRGDKKAQYQIMFYIPLPFAGGFEKFAASAGEGEPEAVQLNLRAFFMGSLASQLNYTVYDYLKTFKAESPAPLPQNVIPFRKKPAGKSAHKAGPGGAELFYGPLADIVRREEFVEKSLRLARAGYAPAQYFLGSSLRDSPPFDEAFYWLKQAAEQSFYPAFLALIDMYNKNEGNIRLRAGPSMAAEWRRAASRFGYSNCAGIFSKSAGRQRFELLRFSPL